MRVGVGSGMEAVVADGFGVGTITADVGEIHVALGAASGMGEGSGAGPIEQAARKKNRVNRTDLCKMYN